MAGRPIYREAVKLIEAQGGEAWVLEALMSGSSTSAVASLADVSRGMLYEWLHKDPERWERYQEARRIGAHALADDALEIADTATSETIAVDRERVRIRQWLAERANREDYGKESAQVAVNLSIGDLHLAAVRETQALPIPEAEWEEIPTLEEML